MFLKLIDRLTQIKLSTLFLKELSSSIDTDFRDLKIFLSSTANEG